MSSSLLIALLDPGLSINYPYLARQKALVIQLLQRPPHPLRRGRDLT
ncbi:MAG TPA: hypothetical protein VGD99_23570 [Anaerolineae bacterium]